MKIKHILLIVCLLDTVCACSKFNDDSKESFTEPEKQIASTWQLTSVTRNGSDISDAMDFTSFHLVLNSDSTYQLVNKLPFVVKKDGTWSVDNSEYPFHLSFKEEGATEAVTSEIKYPVIYGQRRISITLSPGCSSNTYIYVFEKVAD